MIDKNRTSFANNKIAQARQDLQKFQLDGGIQGARHRELNAEEAAATFQWARERMENFAAMERGEDRNYLDCDAKPGSVQANFYHKCIDARFEGDKDGAFRFTEVRRDEDMMFGTPNTTTTIVECDGKKLTSYCSSIDAWGEGSVSLSTLTDLGGTHDYLMVG